MNLTTFFSVFFILIILIRIIELLHAGQNEQYLRAHQAIEYGKKHYPFIVAMHILFLLSMIIEFFIRKPTDLNEPLLLAYVVLMVFKYWTIRSLGPYWNTKIFHIKGMQPVRRGPYKFLKHPNYMIVVAEIVILPLIFQLYTTAIVFTILNAVMLLIRIRIENTALKI